jgi:hypothetical protein
MIPIRSDVDTYQKYAAESIAVCKEEEKFSMEKTEIVQERKKIANEWKERGNSFVKLKDYEAASK